ncbi:MAG: two-component system sensor histidine kinase CreC [Proteobacteria bacterium]|nr:two-component system sensor histidine kinase CreC [Pseudomonadota bacterium]
MKLGLRLILGFFVIAGLAAFFILRVFVVEVRPSVREVMEDMLVDTANILAELAADDLARMPAGGTLDGSRFAQRVRDYALRPIDASIWGVSKRTLDYRVYVTDAGGRVVFDSGAGKPAASSAAGQDYSRWRDVALTLQGRYGARATREVQTDDRTSVMYVAAPVRDGGRVIGVLTVAKPVSTVQPFVDRAERTILLQGAWLTLLSLAVGALVTGWIVWSVRRLRTYAQQVQIGTRLPAPRLSGELGDLAVAMEAMRDRLEGHAHVEQTIRALTHELKSPLAAIGGAAELLHDPLPDADRETFAGQIEEQVARVRSLVERMLELSKLEHRRELEHRRWLDPGDCAQAAWERARGRALQRGQSMRWLRRDTVQVSGEAELLELAIANLIENAIDFAPRGSVIDMSVAAGAQGGVVLSVRDRGTGVERYALDRLGQRYFSTPRPADPGDAPRKGSGLGLAIVRQVMALHGGGVRFENSDPGLRVLLSFRRP